jgi:hypothetical protein
MANHVTNIRRVYGRPWRDGGLANPGKVSTGVAVGVRPKTTLITHETMLDAPPQRSAARTRLAGESRIDVFHRNACRFGLVFDKGLKLPKSPTMQSRSHALARLDAAANMAQVFHHDLGRLRDRFIALQREIVAALEAFDGDPFLTDAWSRPPGDPLQGDGITRLIEQGRFFERGSCNFSHIRGDALPPSATVHRQELAGRPLEALGVSLVLHPRNPYCPTVHLNVRFFVAYGDGDTDPVR